MVAISQEETRVDLMVAELFPVVLAQAGTLTDQQLFSYFNQTYFAIRPYSPDTFIMVSPLIYEVRSGVLHSSCTCSPAVPRQGGTEDDELVIDTQKMDVDVLTGRSCCQLRFVLQSFCGALLL